jgi:hypothetical protein
MESPKENLICLNCGYDLRGTVSGRCSECGTVIEREKMLRSLIPWGFGGSWVFLRTTLKVIFGRKMRLEVYRAHDADLAGRYWKRVAFRIAFTLLVSNLGVEYYFQEGVSTYFLNCATYAQSSASSFFSTRFVWGYRILFDPLFLMGMGFGGIWRWILPMVVWPMAARDFVGAIGESIYWPGERAQKARALGSYLGAYAAAIFIMVMLGLGGEVFLYIASFPCLLNLWDPTYYVSSPWDRPLNILAMAPWGMAAVLYALMLWRVGQWGRRLHGLGWWATLGIVFWLIGTLVWRLFFWLILIPCFVGLIRLIALSVFVW